MECRGGDLESGCLGESRVVARVSLGRQHSTWLVVTLAATLVASGMSLLPIANVASAPASATPGVSSPTVIAYTGGPQQYTVPSNVDTLLVQVVGGSGGGGELNAMYGTKALGGAGGQVIAQISVTPGESLQFNVGGAGEAGPQTLNGTPDNGQVTYHIAKGGWNGGADAGFSTWTYQSDWQSSFVGNYAGGGGGATDIRACFSPQNTICPAETRIIVAGGGGGAGMDNGANTTSAAGGAGGIYSDGSGAPGQANPLTSLPGITSAPAAPFPPGTTNATPGQGGTPTSPGNGGSPTNLAPSGYEGSKFCNGGPTGQGGVPGAGKPGSTDGSGGAGGSGEYAVEGFWSTTFGGGGGGGGYTGGGGGGCGGFAWINMSFDAGFESVLWPGTAGGGGGSSWAGSSRVLPGTVQFGIASLTHSHGYVVIQGLRLGAIGAPQAVTVPNNANAVDYTLNGAQGGDYGLDVNGGAGATVGGSILTSAGEVLQVNVGGGGQVTQCASDVCPPTAMGGPPAFSVATNDYVTDTYAYQSGWNGGGLAVPLSYYAPGTFWGFEYPQAGGGGATDLRVCAPGTTVTSARTTACSGTRAIAAGGGGASVINFWESAVPGGQGGCTAGQEPNDGTDGGAGRGGTQSAGGIGGGAGPSGSTAGQPGAAGVGGNGGSGDTTTDQDRQGAGGGGGLFGGGGGGGGGSVGDTWFHSPGAGGGGSSLTPAGSTCTQGTGPVANAGFSAADGTAELSFPVLVPDQPDNINAAVVPGDATKATVSWTAGSSHGSSVVASNISSSSDGGQTWSSPVVYGASSPITVSGLDPSTPYAFRVSLVNGSGTGPVSKMSNTIRTPATVPAQVTGVTTAAGANAVAVTWSAPADGGSVITSYNLRWSTDGGATWPGAASTDLASTTAVIGDLTSASSYVFQIAAVNEKGAGPWSSSSGSVRPIGVPGAPGTPAVTPAFQAITLHWTAATVAGSPGNGQAISNYQVQATDTVTGVVALLDTTSSTTSYTVNGIFQGHPMTFQVRGVNAGVPGAWSGSSVAVSADGAAGAPTQVVPNPNVDSMQVTWTAPSSLAGGTVTGYRVQQIDPGPGAAWTTAVTTSGTATTATVTGLSASDGYRFRVAVLTQVPLAGGGTKKLLGAWSSATMTRSPLRPPGPVPGPAPEPTSEPTASPATSPSAGPPASTATTPSRPTPGSGTARVGNSTVPVLVRQEPPARPVTSVVDVGGVRGSFVSTDPLGEPNRLTSAGALLFDSPSVQGGGRRSIAQAPLLRGRVRVQLTGLRPASVVLLTLQTSEGILARLDDARADATGALDALVMIPAGLATGPATLQFDAVVQDGQPIEALLGVQVAQPRAQRGRQVVVGLPKQGALPATSVRRMNAQVQGGSNLKARRAVVALTIPSSVAESQREILVRRWTAQVTKALRRAAPGLSVRTTVTVVPTLPRPSATVTLL